MKHDSRYLPNGGTEYRDRCACGTIRTTAHDGNAKSVSVLYVWEEIEPCVRNQITPGCRIHTAKRQSPRCAASKSGQSKRDEHMFLLLDMGSLKRQLGCTLMTGRPCLHRIPWHHTQRCTRESRATSDEEPEPPTDRYAVVFPQEIRRIYTWKHASILHGKERPTATH